MTVNRWSVDLRPLCGVMNARARMSPYSAVADMCRFAVTMHILDHRPLVSNLCLPLDVIHTPDYRAWRMTSTDPEQMR